MQLLIAQGLTLAYLVPLQVMLVRQMGWQGTRCHLYQEPKAQQVLLVATSQVNSLGIALTMTLGLSLGVQMGWLLGMTLKVTLQMIPETAQGMPQHWVWVEAAMGSLKRSLLDCC